MLLQISPRQITPGPRSRRHSGLVPVLAKLRSWTRPASALASSTPSESQKQLWQTAEAICFDVDSTLCIDESIDELATYLGVGHEVAEATARAMQGDAKFEDSLRIRLALMQPSMDQVQRFLDSHPAQLSPGVAELILRLQQRGTRVFLVSGGFRAIIHPIAKSLSIPLDHVYANTILFKEDGTYSGFDEGEHTSRSGGKHSAAVSIKADHGCRRLVMIGDGATDLEARQPGGADMFIGYGGVTERPKIAAAADWYVRSFLPLTDSL
ncbi:hypothetical protein WJX84_011055 [Apatococcus fuscideae]|uniref:phosphoserine phosphatase n=1 Tax=Apatococcus fuscideae TaxID=2026836 RepID=A0AAW1TAP0_9CHLO